jgi:FkbM family methyltransferase
MKTIVQRLLQKLLGYDRYLWYFTLYKLKTLKSDKNENDFFYFLSLLDATKTSLDIGANLGLMTYHLAKCTTKTIAIEPMPNNFGIIEKVIKKYDLSNVDLLKCAVGNKNEQIELVLPEVDGVKKQGLSHVVADKMKEFNEGSTFSVRCVRLDDMVELQKGVLIAGQLQFIHSIF